MANEVKIRITGEDRASADLDRVGRKAKGLGGTMKSLAPFALGAGAALGVAGFGAFKLGQQAADLELQMKKANIVFGDQIAVAEEWARANAHAMGLTRREAVSAAASFADLLIPMNFGREEATKMATEVVGLSGALSEWSGGQRSAEEVSRILAKAMLGERESLKELGISITEAEVKGRLLEKGQQDLTGTALQQAKAIATQELIFEKSKDAQAAYAEGAGSAARKQAELTAKFNEVKETLALKLAPVMTNILSGLLKLGEIIETKVIPPIREWWQEHQPQIQAALERFQTFIQNDVMPAIRGIVEIFQEWWPKIEPIVRTALEQVKVIFETVWAIISGIIEIALAVLEGDWGKAWNALKDMVGEVFDGIKQLLGLQLEQIKNVLVFALAVFAKVFQYAWSGIARFFEDIWEGIKSFLANTWSTIEQTARGWLKNVANAFTWYIGIYKAVWIEFPKWLLGMMTTLAINIWNRAFGVGKAIVEGIWNGIQSLKDWLFDQVRNFATGIFNAVRDGLGSLWPFSPSKAGVDIGVGLVAGIAQGIQDGLSGANLDVALGGLQAAPREALSASDVGEAGGSSFANYGRYQVILPNVRDVRTFNRELDRQLRGL